MDPAAAIRLARVRAKLSKRELARRAGTSPAAVVLYESGSREPSYSTLNRLTSAAGFETRLTVAPRGRADAATLGRRLAEVLELAEHLPHRPAVRRLQFPPLAPVRRAPVRGTEPAPVR
jgi:transcriptional regulator with XRE-family HTH domain